MVGEEGGEREPRRGSCVREGRQILGLRNIYLLRHLLLHKSWLTRTHLYLVFLCLLLHLLPHLLPLYLATPQGMYIPVAHPQALTVHGILLRLEGEAGDEAAHCHTGFRKVVN